MIFSITRLLGTLAGLALASAANAQNISIATGGTGGVYYPMGGGVAAVLSKHVPGMQATAEVTGGSVDNLKLIGTGKPYIAFSMTDAAQDAMRGEDKFKGNKVPLKTLMILYPNRMHVVSVEGKRHRQDGRPEGQARLHRLPRQRHRGDGVSRDRGGRPRQGRRPEARAARRRRVGERPQGRQDRRLLLGRRPADGGGHRPRQHAEHQDQDDRPRRRGGGDEQEVRQPVRAGRDPQGHLQGHGGRQPRRRR